MYDTQTHILPIFRNAFNFISIKVSVEPQNLVLGRQFLFYGLIQILTMKNALKGKFSAMGFFLRHLDPQLYALYYTGCFAIHNQARRGYPVHHKHDIVRCYRRAVIG